MSLPFYIIKLKFLLTIRNWLSIKSIFLRIIIISRSYFLHLVIKTVCIIVVFKIYLVSIVLHHSLSTKHRRCYVFEFRRLELISSKPNAWFLTCFFYVSIRCEFFTTKMNISEIRNVNLNYRYYLNIFQRNFLNFIYLMKNDAKHKNWFRKLVSVLR